MVRSCSAPSSWRYDFPSRHDVGDVVTVSTSDPSAFLNVVLDKPSEDQWTAITLSAGAARQLRDALRAIYPLEAIGGHEDQCDRPQPGRLGAYAA
jgi:hypothetical protein